MTRQMETRDTAFEAECIAYLESVGFRVTRPRAAAPRHLAGKRHESCADHVKVDGYRSPVCILEGQDAREVVAFAQDCTRIGREAGDVLTRSRMRLYGRIEQVAA